MSIMSDIVQVQGSQGWLKRPGDEAGVAADESEWNLKETRDGGKLKRIAGGRYAGLFLLH